MTIYEIDQQIAAMLESGVDEETGELTLDTDALEALQLERDTKVENLALAFKNLQAEAKAIKAEEDALAARRKATEKKAERAKKYLDFVLGGEKFKTARVAVSYRITPVPEIGEAFLAWARENAPDLLRFKEPEPDKKAIKTALEAGREIPGAVMGESRSMTIK